VCQAGRDNSRKRRRSDVGSYTSDDVSVVLTSLLDILIGITERSL
jgi:hypothetical protein